MALCTVSAALCSTQPGFGKICSCSFWSTATIRPSLSKMMQRLEVVPWSMAAMNGPCPWEVVGVSLMVCVLQEVCRAAAGRSGGSGERHQVEAPGEGAADQRADDRDPGVAPV